MIKKNKRTRMAAFVYDLYNKTQQADKFTMEQLCRYHSIGNRFADIVQHRKLMVTGRGQAVKYTWMGDPPNDKLIDNMMEEHHRVNNEYYTTVTKPKQEVQAQQAVHHTITPGFTYVDLTGQNPPEELERPAQTPDLVQVAPVIDTKLMEQYVKAHMLEIMAKMFGNEKDTAGDGA